MYLICLFLLLCKHPPFSLFFTLFYCHSVLSPFSLVFSLTSLFFAALQFSFSINSLCPIFYPSPFLYNSSLLFSLSLVFFSLLHLHPFFCIFFFLSLQQLSLFISFTSLLFYLFYLFYLSPFFSLLPLYFFPLSFVFLSLYQLSHFISITCLLFISLTSSLFHLCFLSFFSHLPIYYLSEASLNFCFSL